MPQEYSIAKFEAQGVLKKCHREERIAETKKIFLSGTSIVTNFGAIRSNLA